MKVLILGGTGFLSKETSRSFLHAGHDVTCTARGVTGTPIDDVEFVPWDRDGAPPFELLELSPDVVVDVSSDPARVSNSLALYPDARWIYISSISVYPAMTEPGGSPADTPLTKPVVENAGIEAYGGLKVACESLVEKRAASHFIIRPGLIVGPGDPTGRFTYWPTRLAEAAADGLPYIAPGAAADPVQWVDVRDLADWIVLLAESGRTGVCEAVAETMTRQQFLAEISSTLDGKPVPVWVDSENLQSAGVSFWSGEHAIPMWLPVPDLKEMMNRDAGPALNLGLRPRPLGETAQDTLSWCTEEGEMDGLSRQDELSVLRKLGHIED